MLSNKGISNECQALVMLEQGLFEQEYRDCYLAGETKPSKIGQPYLMHHRESKKGVLLIHGLMAAPEEVREWAEYLYAAGYSVYAPRMAGHGTSATDLSKKHRQDWDASVARGHEILKHCCDSIVIAGFSTGAAVALQQVILNPNVFDGIISISAPLKFKSFSARFAGFVNSWNKACLLLGVTSATKLYATNHADNPHINYLRCPVSSVVQIQKLMRSVVVKLSTIDIPSLIMHGIDDPKVDVASAKEIFKRISSPHKTYREIDHHLHGIIRGEVGLEVFKEVGLFLGELEAGLSDGCRISSQP